MKNIKRLGVVLLCLIVVLIAQVLVISKSITTSSQNHTIDNPEEVLDKPKGDVINTVILGVDGSGSNGSKGHRTDTIMIMSYNKKSRAISVLSIPRDTRVKIEGKGNDKINHAHAYGGVELTIKTIQQNLQIPIHHYIKLNYNAVEHFIDEIGGLKINVPFHMKYEDPVDNLYIDLKEGEQVLNGIQTLHFLRYRSGYKDGDLGRVAAQQQFVSSLIKQVVKPSNILKSGKIIGIFLGNVDTDYNLFTLSRLGTNIVFSSKDSLSLETIPGTPKLDGTWYYIINRDKAEESIVKFRD